MSAVETIRDIPVIVDHRKDCRNSNFEPMDCYEYNSGFPFDNSSRRSRDPLEDIAQRHPEFAQHLQGFPRRSQRSAGDQNQDESLRRRFERPFSSGRFERFGFPFDRDDFEREPQRYYEAYPEYFENFQNQQPQTPPHNQPQSPQHQQQHQQTSSQQTPQGYQQYPPQYSQEYQPQKSQDRPQSSQHPPQYYTQPSQSVSQGTQTEECVSEEQEQQSEGEAQDQKGEGGQIRGRPIQQSNTCDLTQHQPPDETLNDREPRSMSLPPENKRFTSSVNIPMGGHQENPSAPKSQGSSGSTERVIPIHVEGRDDPVIPKGFVGSPSQSQSHYHQPQPERIFSESPRSQPETIFGRRPEAFTQFVNREPHRRLSNDWPHSFGGFPEEEFGFRRTESPTRFASAKPYGAQQHQYQQHPHYQQQQQRQEEPHKKETASQAHAPKPQAQEQKPSPQPEAAQQPPKQPQPQKQPLGPIEQIQSIQKDVSSLLRQVDAFGGMPKDKNYLYLDEMLTRNLLKLDNVDTQGQDTIRSARKEAIKCIEKAIGVLEAKAAANAAQRADNKMDVEQQQSQQTQDEKMETDVNSQEPSAMEMSPPATRNEEATSKSAEGENAEQQPKSSETMESAEGQITKEEEVKSEEPRKDETVAEETPKEGEEKTEVKEDGEKKTEVKEGEKKEKKKIKKKVNKEDKEKKQ